jgi:hypothetical protein
LIERKTVAAIRCLSAANLIADENLDAKLGLMRVDASETGRHVP